MTIWESRLLYVFAIFVLLRYSERFWLERVMKMSSNSVWRACDENVCGQGVALNAFRLRGLQSLLHLASSSASPQSFIRTISLNAVFELEARSQLVNHLKALALKELRELVAKVLRHETFPNGTFDLSIERSCRRIYDACEVLRYHFPEIVDKRLVSRGDL